MSETQSIKEPKADNSVNATGAEDVNPSVPVAQTAAAAKTVVDALREIGTSWAGTALGYGRVALENVAHAFERTAEKLGALQDKLKKGDVAAAGAR